jgi:hypothetical protein
MILDTIKAVNLNVLDIPWAVVKWYWITSRDICQRVAASLAGNRFENLPGELWKEIIACNVIN